MAKAAFASSKKSVNRKPERKLLKKKSGAKLDTKASQEEQQQQQHNMKWAHATNSVKLVKDALADSEVEMVGIHPAL